MLSTTLSIIDIIIFVVFALNVLYLFVFSIISLKHSKTNTCAPQKIRKMVILIPAYKEDSVIIESAKSCALQDYPHESFDVVVISDQMQEETISRLLEIPVKVVRVNFKNSTKSKALNFAMNEISDYDIAVIMDADNIVKPSFLSDINREFDKSDSVQIVQAHRVAKNINTDMAFLDAASEEINNSIFRKAHSSVGLSAALIGSGMAFNYSLFKETMKSIDAVGGFDKALELKLTHEGIRTYYLHDTLVLDEKVQQAKDFSRQRSRWLSAQYHYLNRYMKYFFSSLLHDNADFCDKLFQQASIPRLLLLGGIIIIAILLTIFAPAASLKWWGLFLVLCIALLLSIPKSFYNVRMIKAIVKLPYYFGLFFLTLFKLRGANKSFIHTAHGVNDKKQ
jgi:cellulose synthase/poly-beta-1,6-N-acetylglucosamine synthase-like glycosyltransferase